MPKSIYLINPAADFPTYYGAEVYAGRGYAPAVFLSDLVLPTLAAMIPSDWHVELCDEHLEPVDFDTDCGFIGITGKISQWNRSKVIAAEFRRRGKTVVMGGPHASLSPEFVRPHCDVLVRDEIEEIVDDLFADLASGDFRSEYRGGRPDLALTPVPRWDLYERYNDRVLTATLQTARGCPFECEFCDVIQYVGRQQRQKPIENILAELDAIYASGYRSILLADDNTTANKGWVKEMLAAVRVWNDARTEGRVALSTQLSIDAARDDELLRMMGDAGMTHVFIGIETINEASLIAARKNQNLTRFMRNTKTENPTMIDQVDRFFAHGIGVTAGMICGFDHDDHTIFQQQLDFAMGSGIPILTLSALAAPHATPLHARLEGEGRLLDGYEVPGQPWNTNMTPRLMSRTQLTEGIRWLANELYHPANFGARLLQYIDRLEYSDPAVARLHKRKTIRSVDRDTIALISDIPRMDAESARMWKRIMAVLPKNPGATIPVMEALIRYQQLRYMYETGHFWDPPQARPDPVAASAG